MATYRITEILREPDTGMVAVTVLLPGGRTHLFRMQLSRTGTCTIFDDRGRPIGRENYTVDVAARIAENIERVLGKGLPPASSDGIPAGLTRTNPPSDTITRDPDVTALIGADREIPAR